MAFQLITVLGAGAVGGWIAARLALAGHNVRVLARGTTLRLLQAEGLCLEQGGRMDQVRVLASGDAAALGPADLLILGVKATGLREAAHAARPLIGPATLILPLLNGVPWWFMGAQRLQSVDPDGTIASALPTAQLAGCVVHAAASRTAPNHVVVKHADRLILGAPAGGYDARVDQLASVLEQAGITVECSQDVRQAIWYKLWGNATINPLSALTGSTADRLLVEPATRALILDAMAELSELGARIGCPIAETGEDRLAVTARLGAFKPSMLQDAEARRPLELEALLGAPREIARRIGVPTPQLDRIHALARLFAESRGLF
jgi:2-dehydropantoate 2-reductase